MPRLSHNTRIGMALSLAAVAVLAWSLLGKPTPLGSHDIVRAQFRDVSSLIRFNRDVRLAGADVGRIGKVTRTGDTALVELVLDRDIARALHADASAELRPHTLFDGNSFIELDPGSPSAPPLGNHVIPLSRTRNYVTLDKALRVLDTPTRTALQHTLGALASALQEPEIPALRRTLSGLPNLMRNTARWAPAAAGPHGTELAGAIRGFARTTSAIAKASPSIPPLLDSTVVTAGAVNASGPALSRTLGILPGALASTRRGSVALRETLVALEPVAGGLVPVMQRLNPTLTALRPVLRRLGPALQRSRPFLADLRATLDAGAQAAPPTTRLVTQLQPTLGTLRGDVIPYLQSRGPAGNSIIQSLGALGAAGAGVLSTVNTANGVGHLWTAKISSPLLVPCGSVPSPALARQLSRLELCTP